MADLIQDRLSVLDPLLDEWGPHDDLAAELFAVVDALDSSATLRRVLPTRARPKVPAAPSPAVCWRARCR